mmetsp:Transcript_22200/g.46831  ORF Transcript_22200/g.46831 Transcript_22200/m.46831 type:complete len:550 (-) Transcript_22200:408-2057(-)
MVRQRVLRVYALFGVVTCLLSNSPIGLKDLRRFTDLSGYYANSEEVGEPNFPDDLTYTKFLELYTDRPNYTTMLKNASVSPLLQYFPDFCADCMWSPQMTCQSRAFFLQNNYGTPNPEQALMDDKNRVTCKNPPLKIFWQDDGVDELDNVFVQPKIQRENITYSPMMGNLTIFFYETLRPDMGADLVEKMRTQYSDRNNSETNAQADIAIIDLFRTFPGRTDNPSEADIFVVPYPHASHCVSKPTGVWKGACAHIAYNLMKDGVFNTLNHYIGNERRHLFLNVINQGNSNPTIRNTPLSITIGPRYKDDNIIVPYMNNLPSFQPSAVRSHGMSWWTRPRTYVMTYFFGISNSKMRNSPRHYRKGFMQEVQSNWPETLGGLPYAIRVMTRGYKPPSRVFTHMYKDSIFCPTLPGDTPPQKRFFDVIMMGCIPVVLSFPTQGNMTSWHQPGGQPIENSYPWIKGSDSVDPSNEIDYRSFVVEVTGGVENVRPTIEALMNNYTEIRRRQLALMKYAPYFTYGMGEDAHKYTDSFSKILESLRHYLDGKFLGS